MSVIARFNQPSPVMDSPVLRAVAHAQQDLPPRVTLTAPNGEEFLLTSADPRRAGITILRGPSGLDMPPTTVKITEYAQIAGGQVTKTRKGVRPIVLPLIVWAPSRRELRMLKRRLIAALDPDLGDSVLRTAEADGSGRRLRVRYTGGLEGDEGEDTAGLSWIKYGLGLTACDPYWYGTERARSWAVTGSPQFLSYPQGYWKAEREDTMGDAAAWPKVGGANASEVHVIADNTATDGVCLRLNGYATVENPHNVPYDPKSLYRISFRVRLAQPPARGLPYLHAGLTGIAADGTTRINTEGSDTIGGQHCMSARQAVVPDGGGWVEYVGFARGHTPPGQVAPAGPNPDENDPEPLHAGITYVRPLICGLYEADGGHLDIDHVTISRVVPNEPDGGTEKHLRPFLPLRVAPATIADDGHSIDVNSDVDVWPVWRITGPLGEQDTGDPTIPIKITNKTTGQQLALLYGLPADRTLVVDTRPGIKAVYLETRDGSQGLNLWPYVTSSDPLWPLRPGKNVIAITAAGATADTSIELAYTPRYLTY